MKIVVTELQSLALPAELCLHADVTIVSEIAAGPILVDRMCMWRLTRVRAELKACLL